jgi:hypothetical protein
MWKEADMDYFNTSQYFLLELMEIRRNLSQSSHTLDQELKLGPP